LSYATALQCVRFMFYATYIFQDEGECATDQVCLGTLDLLS